MFKYTFLSTLFYIEISDKYANAFSLNCRLSDAFEVVTFSHGDYIVRQGTSGDTFYVISEGQVRVTRRVEGKYYSIYERILLLL